MATLDFPPAAFEVEDQLKRMLASPRFRNAPNPSAFLELTVRRALNGKKTTGHTVAKALFEGKFFQGFSSDVRSTALNLRKTLKRYYDHEGRGDVVLITYPEPLKDKTIKPVEGEAYTPRFAYNPEHQPFILVRVGYRLLEKSTYRDYQNAVELFVLVIDSNPRHLGALLGLAEALIKFGENGWTPKMPEVLARSLCPVDAPNPQSSSGRPLAVNICDGIFSQLEGRAQDYWRYWAARAQYSHSTKGTMAAAYYAKALRLDRPATESFLPYIDHLIRTGELEEALGLAQRFVNERIEDSIAVGEYGRLLCYAGRFEHGIGHLQVALKLDPGNCGPHQTMAVIRFMQRDLDGLASHLRALQALCDAESFSRFTAVLEEHEEQYELKGSVANLLLELPNAAAAAIVKL